MGKVSVWGIIQLISQRYDEVHTVSQSKYLIIERVTLGATLVADVKRFSYLHWSLIQTLSTQTINF